MYLRRNVTPNGKKKLKTAAEVMETAARWTSEEAAGKTKGWDRVQEGGS